MRILYALAFCAMVILAGCVSQPDSGPPEQQAGKGIAPAGVEQQQENTSPQINPEQPPVTGEGTIIDVPSASGGAETGTQNTKPAASQQDCATLSPSCGTCVSKPNCGWCKGSNGCYFGDENGPADAQCQQSDWALTPQECEAPASPEGTSCEEQTNCAFCLSGSGCKWCQEGTKCRDTSSTESCGAGGWRTISYQCYAGQ